MLALLSTWFVSIFAGGATGLAGVAIQRYFDMKKYDKDLEMKRMDQNHELSLRKQDAELMKLESEAQLKVAAVSARSLESVEDSKAFAFSMAQPVMSAAVGTITKNQNWFYVMIDFIRGLVRPVLTVYLCAVMTWIYVDSLNLITREGMTASPEEAYGLINKVVASALYLCTTCVLWWFGTRNKQKPPSVRDDRKREE